MNLIEDNYCQKIKNCTCDFEFLYEEFKTRSPLFEIVIRSNTVNREKKHEFKKFMSEQYTHSLSYPQLKKLPLIEWKNFEIVAEDFMISFFKNITDGCDFKDSCSEIVNKGIKEIFIQREQLEYLKQNFQDISNQNRARIKQCRKKSI